MVMRGQSLTPYNNHILVLINGRPVRDPTTGGHNNPIYTAFPLDLIEKVEVIRGPGSVLYGSCAFAGVINIITREPSHETLSGTLGLKAGSWGAFGQDVTLNLVNGEFSGIFGISHFKDRGPTYRFTDYLDVTDEAQWHRNPISFFSRLEFKGFHLQATYADLEIYSLDGTENSWDHEHARTNNNHTTLFVDVGHNLNFGSKLSFDTNLTYNRHLWDMSSSTNMIADDVMVESTIHYRPIPSLSVQAGGNLASTTYSGSYFIDDEIFSASFYLQLDYNPIKAVKMIGGLQYNKIEDIDGNLSPRIGIIANLSKHMGVKLLYSKAFRRAYPHETSFDHPVFRGNKEIKPELIATSEAQVFYQSQTLQVFLTAFYSRMSDIIIRRWHEDTSLVPYAGYIMHYNGGSHQFWGMELEAKGSMAKNLLAVGSLTFQENKNEEGIVNATLHPNFMFKVGLLYHRPALKIGLFNSFFSTPHPVKKLNPEVKEVNPEAGTFDLLSLKASIDLKKILKLRWCKSLSFAVEAANLLNQDIRYPEYTTKGINTLLPLRGGTSFYTQLKCKF
jgi:outer membrane receptor for ferrienterochelin and colicin